MFAYRVRKYIGAYAAGLGSRRPIGSFLLLEVPRSIMVGTAPGAIGCAYYEASFRELLLLLIGSIGAVEHVRCTGRGEGTCEWRADWRSFVEGFDLLIRMGELQQLILRPIRPKQLKPNRQSFR